MDGNEDSGNVDYNISHASYLIGTYHVSYMC